MQISSPLPYGVFPWRTGFPKPGTERNHAEVPPIVPGVGEPLKMGTPRRNVDMLWRMNQAMAQQRQSPCSLVLFLKVQVHDGPQKGSRFFGRETLR